MDKNVTHVEVNIADIKPGDTIFHNGQQRTVCRNNIIDGGFMGRTIFGDSYLAGHKPVIKVTFNKADPYTGNFYIRHIESGLFFSGFDENGEAVFKGPEASKPYATEQEALLQIMFFKGCEVKR